MSRLDSAGLNVFVTYSCITSIRDLLRRPTDSERVGSKAPSRFEFPFACKEWVRPRPPLSNTHLAFARRQMGNLPFAAYPFARERTHSITGRTRRDGADREKCVLPSPSSHKATLVNQPEMLITEEGGRADGQRREGGWRKGRRTIDRGRERASEREVLCRPAAFCNSDLCGRVEPIGQILLVPCTRASLARRWSSVRL